MEKIGKKKGVFISFSLGMKVCPRHPLLVHRIGKNEMMYLLDIGSVGTGGARTRSFRLDRAVL